MQTEKNLWLRVLSMILTLALLISCVPNQVYAMAGEALADLLERGETVETIETPNNSKRGIYEVVERREANVKHFALEDGSYTAVMYNSAVHTQDAEGNWQDIDNRLSDSGSEFSTSNARIKFAKKITGNENLFTLHDGNRKITMSLNNAVKKTTGAVTNHTTEFDSEATQLQKLMTLDNLSSEILYADILDGVDLQYVVESLNVKENIIVKEQKDSYQYTFTIALNNLEAEMAEDGSVRICDPSTKETVYNIPAGFMYDANGEYSTAVTYTLTNGGTGKYSLTVTADAAWINAEERAFPVVIDPPIKVGEEFGYQATSIHAWMPNENGHQLGYLATGTHGIAYWKTENLPDIPSGAIVKNAGFLMAAYNDIRGYTNASFQLELGVYRVLTEWDQETLTYALYENGAGTISRTANDSQRGSSVEYSYDLNITEYVRDWYNDPSSNHGVAVTAIGDYNNGMDKLYRFVYGYQGAAMHITYDDGHGYNGVESYWSLSSQSAGVAGCGTVNNATGHLTFAIGTLTATDNLFSYAPSLVYNQSGAGKYFIHDENPNTVYMQPMAGYGFMLNMQESIIRDTYIDVNARVKDYYIWIDSDGTAHEFYLKEGCEAEYADDDGLQLTLTMDESYYLLEDQNHTIRKFARITANNGYIKSGGYLTQIVDNVGNYISFDRNAAYQITAITLHPVNVAGITLLTFTYNSYGLIQSISNTPANQVVNFYYSLTGNTREIPSQAARGYLRKIEHVFSDEVVATADYYYDNDGKLVMVRDLTSGYVLDYAYDGQRVRSVKELANSNTEGQLLEFSYRQQYTEIRSSGSDDLYGNDDDIVNAYIFDDENRLVSCYSMNALRTMIYGAASGEYETQENVKNNIKTSTTVGGTASNYLFNGGFEDITEDNQPLGWDVTEGNIEMSELEPEIYDRRAIKFNVTKDGTVEIRQQVALLPGTYNVSVDIESLLCDDIDMQIIVTLPDNTQVRQDIPLSLMRVSEGAKNSSLTFTVEMGENDTLPIKKNITVALVAKGGASVIAGRPEIYADNIMLEENVGQNGYSMVEFGNFEYFFGKGGPNTNHTPLTEWTGISAEQNIVATGDLYGNVLKIDQKVDDEAQKEALLEQAQSGSGNYLELPIPEDVIRAQQVIYEKTPGSLYNANRKTFVISGMAKGTSQIASGEFKIEIYVAYTDNDSETFCVDFYYGTTEWQFATGSFTTKKANIASVELRLIYRNNPGEAYFDNIYVSQIVDDTTVSTEYYPTGKPKSQENGYYQEAYEYDDNDNLTKIFNNRGELFEYTYDGYLPVSEMYSLYEWDNSEVGYSKEVQNETVYTYNDQGLLLQTVTYEGAKEDLESVTGEPNRVIAKYTYDTSPRSRMFGALLTETDNLNITTEYIYHASNGRLLAVLNQNTGEGTCYTYDAIGNVTSVLPAIASTTGGKYTPQIDKGEVFYAYDGANRLTSISTRFTDYHFTYDAFGKTEDVSIGRGDKQYVIVDYVYNPNNGKLKQIKYSNGFTVTYEYDALDNISKVLYNDQEAYIYHYNANGLLYRFDNLLSGNTTVYQYDVSKRLVSYVEFAGDVQEIAFSTTIRYDEKSQISQAKYVLDYLDKAGRTHGTFTQYAFGYTDEGIIANCAFTAARLLGNVAYEYDKLDRLTKKTLTYNSTDLSKHFEHVVEYTFSSAEFEMDGTTVLGTSAQVSKYTSTVGDNKTEYVFTYDESGNITKIVSGGKETRYYYDSLGQLRREDNTALNTTYTYLYDPSGNIRQKNIYALTPEGATPTNAIDTIVYSYNSSKWGDQMTTYDGVSLRYDPMGNPLTYYNGTRWNMVWENGRQLKAAMTGGKKLSFTYNDEGIRTSKTVNGVVHTYRLNGSQIIAEEWTTADDDGTTVEHMILFLYDAEGAPIGMQYRNQTYAPEIFDVYWFEKNLQGDVVAVYDEDGDKLISYIYDAWGNFTTTYYNDCTTASTANYNPFRYRSYYYDAELKMYYLQSRYYDSSVGRFLTADKLSTLNASPFSLTDKNLFAYCDSNPVMRKDDGGMFWDTVFDVVSLAFSVAEVVVNPADPWAWAGMIGDVVDLIPFVSGVGEVTKALGAAKKAGELLDDVHDAKKAIENMAELAEAGQDGYKTFKTAKKNMEAASDVEWHHLVEQSQAGRSGFAKTSINNSSNLVGIGSDLHHKISGFYSSKPTFLKNADQYKTVRDWVSTLSYQQQYTFGVFVLQRAKYMP